MSVAFVTGQNIHGGRFTFAIIAQQSHAKNALELDVITRRTDRDM